jgi:hypothetical protein
MLLDSGTKRGATGGLSHKFAVAERRRSEKVQMYSQSGIYMIM